jgi:hypothetical protein
MRIYLLFILMFACCIVNAQCPPASLQIQTPICDSPRNLKANTIDCSKLKVNWKGNKDQTYIVEASCADPNTNSIIKKNGKDVSCDDDGNCSAIIPVKEGVMVNWNVQSECSINSVLFYSYKIEGDSVLIPYCAIASNTITSRNKLSEAISVFPNPTTGYLTVEYNSNVPGNIKFEIYNSSGMKVFETSDILKKSNNQHQLDLRHLLSGTYFLKIINGVEATQVRFILMHN